MDQLIAQPDLDSQAAAEISSDNLNAIGAVYFAYQLEEMRLFEVVERIVDLFQQGLVPLGQGGAVEPLEQVAHRPRDVAAAVRRNAYWRLFGLARGEAPQGEPNAEFRTLWTHFIVTVADRAARDQRPAAIDAETRAASRALVLNLSTRMRGDLKALAQQVTADVQQAMNIVSDRDVQRAFGARSAWQVIDRINASHLGTPVDIARFRRQANAAQRIFDRLARLQEPTRDTSELVAAVDEWIAAQASSAPEH